MLRELEHSQEVISKLLSEMPGLKEDITVRLNDINELEKIKMATLKEIEDVKYDIQEEDMKLYELVNKLHLKFYPMCNNTYI